MSKKGKFNNNRFGKMFNKLRREAGISQVNMANELGVSSSALGRIERGEVSPLTTVGELMLHSGIFSPQFVKEESARRELDRKEEEDQYRIQNIPNFYKKLHSLTACGRRLVDVPYNHPVLIELQRALGVPESSVGKLNLEVATQRERIAVADVLRGIREARGGLTQSQLARKLGIKVDGYRPIEFYQLASTSDNLQRVVTHSFFTEEEREQLQEAYRNLQGREQAVRMLKVSNA